jgi:HEAT repeat protein
VAPEGVADGEEEAQPTELDLAVDAYLEGDAERASDVERLAAEMLEERQVDPVSRSVGRLASAGDPPDASAVDLARAIASPVVLGRLARTMGRERDEERRRDNYRACRALGADMARAIRDDLAENTEALARHVHCEALVEMGPAGREVIEEMAQDEIWFLARNAIAILGDAGGDRAVELVTGALANPDARVRREALRSLAKLGATDAGELVVGLLDDTDEDVQMAAAVAAGELHVERALKPLVAMLGSTKDPDRVIPLIRALGQLGDPGAVPAIEKHAVLSLFSKPRTDVRITAYRALYHIGTPHAIKLLARASSDKDAEVQAAVLSLRGGPAPEDEAEAES